MFWRSFIVITCTHVPQITKTAGNREWTGTEKTNYLKVAVAGLTMDHSYMIAWVMALCRVGNAIHNINSGLPSDFDGYDMHSFIQTFGERVLEFMGRQRDVNEIAAGARVINLGIHNILMMMGVQSTWLFEHYFATLADAAWKA
jgi:hypothetical protein